jgi:hypothetical protein
MPGVTSAQSKVAQGAPTKLVTTNEAGDLAAHTPDELRLGGTTIDITANPSITRINEQITNINNQITILRQNDRRLMDGIAATLALSQPVMPWGKTAALNIGWGNFEGRQRLRRDGRPRARTQLEQHGCRRPRRCRRRHRDRFGAGHRHLRRRRGGGGLRLLGRGFRRLLGGLLRFAA